MQKNPQELTGFFFSPLRIASFVGQEEPHLSSKKGNILHNNLVLLNTLHEHSSLPQSLYVHYIEIHIQYLCHII